MSWILCKSVRALHLEMDWVTRQKVVVKVPLEDGFKEQGGLHDMKWINIKKGDRV